MFYRKETQLSFIIFVKFSQMFEEYAFTEDNSR